MNNPNDDQLPTYEPDLKQLSIKLVWLLNLIPYTGAGYIYALGKEKAIKQMIFFWIFMLVFGPGTLVPVYFILSALGTAHILNQNRSKNLGATGMRRTSQDNDEIRSVPRGEQVSLGDSPGFANVSLMNKIQQTQKKIKMLSGEADDNDKSTHALEAFEYKALAAEKQLKARSDAEAAEAAAAASSASNSTNSFDPDPPIDFAPTNAPTFSDQSGNFADTTNAIAPQAVQSSTFGQTGSNNISSGSTDFINQINSSYSIDAEVSRLTSGVERTAAGDNRAVNRTYEKETAAVDASTKDVAPNSVPEARSVLVNSEQSVPEVASMLIDSTQLAPDVSSVLFNSTQSTPEVVSLLVNSEQVTPDVSSQLYNSTQTTPEVSSQLYNSTQSAPDVGSQLVDSTQVAPDVSAQLVNSTQVAPDVSTQLVNSTQSAPDVNSQLPDSSHAFGNFEIPKFSFSFEDHMAKPLSTDLHSDSAATSAAPCPKCGAARDANFSFCLACGQSFL